MNECTNKVRSVQMKYFESLNCFRMERYKSYNEYLTDLAFLRYYKFNFLKSYRI